MSCISGPVRWNAVALGYFWLFALLNRCIFSSLLPHSELGKSRQLPSTKAPPMSKALALSGNYHKLSGLHMGCLCLVQVGSRASARVHSLATDEGNSLEGLSGWIRAVPWLYGSRWHEYMPGVRRGLEHSVHCCATWGKVPNLSEGQLLHLWNGANTSCLVGLLEWLINAAWPVFSSSRHSRESVQKAFIKIITPIFKN